jgi:DNA replication protein DnaC
MTVTLNDAALVEIDRLCRRLRMPYVRRQAHDVIATAKAQRWDPAEVVRVLLDEEARGRDTSTIEIRRRRAAFPAGKTFDTFDPARFSIPAATQRALASLEWVGRHENLVVAGPSGTGKSHFCEALGHAAINANMTVTWLSVEQLGGLVARHRITTPSPKHSSPCCARTSSSSTTSDCCRSPATPPKASTDSSTPPTNDAP